jgi:hypothetical protein
MAGNIPLSRKNPYRKKKAERRWYELLLTGYIRLLPYLPFYLGI